MIAINIVLYLLFYITTAVVHEEPIAKIPGDFIIGSFFGIVEPKNDIAKKSKNNERFGIQILEAALMSIDEINNNDTILPGVRLGLEGRNDKLSEKHVIEQLVSMFWGASTPNIPHITNQSEFNNNMTKHPIIGVIGPTSSQTSPQVQHFLRIHDIPQIGFSSRAPSYKEKAKYPKFFHINNCDGLHIQMLMDIVERYNWTYVAVVYSEGHDTQSLDHIRKIASIRNICISDFVEIDYDDDDKEYDAVIEKLSYDDRATVVLCFIERWSTIRRLAAASLRRYNINPFKFVAIDGWSNSQDGSKNYDNLVGSISVHHYTPICPEFIDYYSSLNPYNNTRNPWFAKFWQTKYNCEMPMSVNSNDIEESPGKICTGEEYQKSKQFISLLPAGYVIKSVLALAYGLHSMMTEVCGTDYYGVCDEMYPFNYTLYANHLRDTEFYFHNEIFSFKRNCSSDKFSITACQSNDDDTSSFEHIGYWQNNTIFIRNNVNATASSTCTVPCQPGYYKDIANETNKQCCWRCSPCLEYEIVSVDEYSCTKCEVGSLPNENRTVCVEIPACDRKWGHVQGIVLSVFPAIGIIATLVTFYIFIKNRNTPIVKASSAELSYIILFGILLSQIPVIISLLQRTVTFCILRHLMINVSSSLMYSALLVKTYRIRSILAMPKNRFPKTKYRFLSTSSLIKIAIFLTTIQIIMSTTLMIVETPTVYRKVLSQNDILLNCDITHTVVIVPLVYNVILMLSCMFDAFRARKIPKKYNESKYIGFLYAVILLLNIGVYPIYFGNLVDICILSITLSITGLIMLTSLFFPKLYIIIWRPENNIKDKYVHSPAQYINDKVSDSGATTPSTNSKNKDIVVVSSNEVN